MVTEQKLKEYVQSGGIIESVDEMSEGYKKMLIDTLTIVADTEIMGGALYYSYLINNPDIEDKHYRRLVALIQDEVGHAHVQYRLIEDMGGPSVEQLLYERNYNEFNYPFAMDMPIDNFEEVSLIATFQDRCGAVLLMDPFENTSYGPWKRTLVKVEIEERFHVRLGMTLFRELASNPETKARLQRAVDWMFPLCVEWFGVPDNLKKRKDQLEYVLRKKSNDELRQEWLKQVIELCEENDIKIPAHFDPEKNEAVLDYPFPCEFDVENKKWLFDKPVTWDDAKKRWKLRGPNSQKHVGYIQESYKAINSAGGFL